MSQKLTSVNTKSINIPITALLWNLTQQQFSLGMNFIKFKTSIYRLMEGTVKEAEPKITTCNYEGTQWLPGTAVIIYHFLTSEFKSILD